MFDKVDLHLPGYQKVGEVAHAPAKIPHIKDKHFSYPSGAQTTNIDSSVNDANYKLIALPPCTDDKTRNLQEEE